MPKPNVGGQAVIEGVMMKNGSLYATAIRKPDKDILIDKRKYVSLTERHKLLGLPFVRGAVAFLESMIIGMKILTFSAEFFEVDEEEQPSKLDLWLEKKFGDKVENAVIAISVVLAMLFALGLFLFLPATLSQLMRDVLPSGRWMNLADGIIRIAILLIYLVAISRLKDIQRVFQYHGAEHKTIHCYECDEPLTVENVRRMSRLHKRCGTNFIFIVVAISVIVLTVINVQTYLLRLAVRLLCLPIIAGISYEVLKLFGRKDSGLVDILTYPGLMLQKITTSEPDDAQIEIAIAALNASLEESETAEDDN